MDRATESGWKRGRGQVSDRVRDRVRTRGNESERQRQKERERERERGKGGGRKERVSFISAFKSPLGSVRRLGWHILGCRFDSTQHFTRTGRSVALNSLPLLLSPLSHLGFLLLLTTVPSSPSFSFHACFPTLCLPPLSDIAPISLHSVSSAWISHFHPLSFFFQFPSPLLSLREPGARLGGEPDIVWCGCKLMAAPENDAAQPLTLD